MIKSTKVNVYSYVIWIQLEANKNINHQNNQLFVELTKC